MKIEKLFHADLHLFEGEGTGNASEGSAEAESTTAGYTPRHKKSGEFDNVVFGIQPSEGQEDDTNTEDTTKEKDAASEKGEEPKQLSKEEKRKAFNELIKGEYKDEFADAHQEIFDRRFKDHKELEARDAKTKPIIEALMVKYGIEDNDMEALNRAIQSDDDIWEEAADREGMTVDQYKKFQELQSVQQELEDLRNRERAREQVSVWMSEAEQLKTKFPQFDLSEEVKDARFLAMLKAGVPIEHAFRTMHFEELQANAATSVAQQTQKSVADSIRAKGIRPDENGTKAQNGFIVKSDVSKLTKEDRAEIAKRAMRGDRIVF